MTLKKDFTNKKFGKLLSQSVHSRSRNGHVRWQCLCECGNTHLVLSTHLSSGKITSCGCTKNRSGTKTKTWKGCGDISGNVWYSIQAGARKTASRAEMEFSISIEYAWDVFIKQQKRCCLSGELLLFEHSDGIKVRDFRTASLDRIDSDKGYVEGNVQWVHKDINLMKGKLDEDVFKAWCSKVSCTTLKPYWQLTWRDIDEINSVLNGELSAVQADEASPIRSDS